MDSLLATTGLNCRLYADLMVYILHTPVIQIMQQADCVLQRWLSYKQAEALLSLPGYRNSVCSGNLIAAIEHLMNWISSDSDDPGQCCPATDVHKQPGDGNRNMSTREILLPNLPKKSHVFLSVVMFDLRCIAVLQILMQPSLMHR